MKNKIAVFLVLVFGAILLNSVFLLPGFGSWGNRGVADYYLQTGLEATGSANIVNSILWDFRGWDTLGEETVIFTAALGVFLVIRRKKYGHYSKERF